MRAGAFEVSAGGLLRVRGMLEADLDEVLRIQDACYTEIVPESAASLLAKLRATPATCFVAQMQAGVAGYLIAAPVAYPALPALDAPTFSPPAQPDALYLHDLALSASARGTGAGRALVQQALAQARASRLPLACLVAIQQSAPYWQLFGFRAVTPPRPAVAAKVASYGAGAELMVMQLGA